MSEEKDTEPVNTPMDGRHIQALNYIKATVGFSTKVDAVRKSVIEYAKTLGWTDPENPHPEPPFLAARKATR